MPQEMSETLTIGNVPATRIGRVADEAQRHFFRSIPKVELHCHLLGSVRRDTFVELARMHSAPLSDEEMEGFYRRGAKPVGVLRALRALERYLLLDADHFRRITYEYLADAAAEDVRHAEFFWNPTATVRDAGLAYGDIQQAILQGIKDARTEFGVSALLIPSIDREADPSEAVQLVEMMIANRHDGVVGLGIDYGENDRPPEMFSEAFALARRNGFKLTAHAGEFGTPWTNVATAVDRLKVDRVDHGYTIVDNPELARSYAERGIVFTVVPTNSYYMRTLAPERWAAEHPIRRMTELGLKVHPNTDDPTLHRVSPAGAWELMWSHFGYDPADLRAMMLNGIEGSWADPSLRAEWTATWPKLFDEAAAQAKWPSAELKY